MRTLNTIFVERIYNETFENLKIILKKNILKEVEKNLEEKSIEEYFAHLQSDSDVQKFVEQDDTGKINDLLSWFKGELWNLEGPVYDFTRDGFDFKTPNESFEIETKRVSNQRGQFNYLILSL